MPNFHDSTFKAIFDHPRAVRDLFLWLVRLMFGAALDIARFDLPSLERAPENFVTEAMRQMYGDRLWRVKYRAADGSSRWVYLLILLEFQSSVDRDMALRIHAYTAQLLLQVSREGQGGDGNEDRGGRRRRAPLSPVLPIVIYNGRAPWTAAFDVRDDIAPVEEAIERFQPRQRYLLLDVHRQRLDDLPEGNVVAARVALEHGDSRVVRRLVGALERTLAEPEHAGLLRAFSTTLQRMIEADRFGPAGLELAAELKRASDEKDLGAMLALFEERIDKIAAAREARGEARGVEIGKARGVEIGEAQGEARGVRIGLERERALLARLAGRKFGADAASRLAAAVAGVGDPDLLEEVGDAVMLCATAAEFMERAEKIARRG